MLHTLCEAASGLDQAANLGVAGLMGVMWLWERHTSRVREKQIDESHARIMTDRVELDQLMDIVRQNAEAMTKLSATQQQLIEQMRES
jgi:hypothetical protein